MCPKGQQWLDCAQGPASCAHLSAPRETNQTCHPGCYCLSGMLLLVSISTARPQLQPPYGLGPWFSRLERTRGLDKGRAKGLGLETKSLLRKTPSVAVLLFMTVVVDQKEVLHILLPQMCVLPHYQLCAEQLLCTQS